VSADTAVDRLGAGRDVATVELPSGAMTTVHELATFDGAKVHGVLHRVAGSTTVVTLMHPRQSLTHHPMVAWLLRAGVSVWTQDSRSVNNDLNLVHEQALLDVAAGMTFLRETGYGQIVTLGHSGGGTLYAFYIEQATLEPEFRIDITPAGRPIALAGADMPIPDGSIFMAPHPGQGKVLLSLIDPSIADENDPMSRISELDMYYSANGFQTPPHESRYAADWLAEYRQAQYARVERIDKYARALARDVSGHRSAFAASGSIEDRRRSLAPRIITTYRTNADPRCIDLTLDRNDRPYGSLFGARPDLINYGLVGFGRLTTPDAWLSTWSAISTNADFVRCAAGIHLPTLYLNFTGDQAAFPSDVHRMFDAIATTDKQLASVPSQHFGQPLRPGDATGYELAARQIQPWLTDRFT
jgi:hypothetical protein